MSAVTDRRRWPRTDHDEPLLGIIHLSCVLASGRECAEKGQTHHFVDILNTCPTGAQIDTPAPLGCGTLVSFLYRDPVAGTWRSLNTKVVWSRPHPTGGMHRSGLEYLSEQPCDCLDNWSFDHDRPQPGDLESLLGSTLLSSVPKPAAYRLLDRLWRGRIEAGQQLVSQGAPGDALYIIHSGRCSVVVDNRGESHVVTSLGPGDIVGEMAVLTGEPRMASVRADTDLDYWELSREHFEGVAGRHPDLRHFLTELVTRRLECSPITAERTIGKYVIESKLGKGGWSLVYSGRHKSLGLKVVVKMLKHDMAMEPNFLATFRQEAEIIARLSHPNIVQVFDIEELYHTVFIIMERLEGLALSEIIERYGPVSIPRTIDILAQTLRGLAYAHETGIIHRDLKPANLFVQSKDRIKILDFGLACPPGAEDHSIAGTPHYAPPEQIEGDPVDERADLYSLGITAYEMLAGKRPYPEDDLGRLMDLHVKEDLPDPAEAVPHLPSALREFILTCCRRAPQDRYPSAAKALDALRPLVRELGLLGQQDERRRREIASLLMFYGAEQETEVRRLVDTFRQMAKDKGISVRLADFREQ